MDLPAVSAEMISGTLALIDALETVIGRLDAEIHRHAGPTRESRSSPVCLAWARSPRWSGRPEIGDITRFASARKPTAWAGLTPMVRGSDRIIRHGHIPGGARCRSAGS